MAFQAMRKRQTKTSGSGQHQPGNRGNNNDSINSNNDTSRGRDATFKLLLACGGIGMIVIGAWLLFQNNNNHHHNFLPFNSLKNSTIEQQQLNNNEERSLIKIAKQEKTVDLTTFRNCSISFQPPPEATEWTTKTLWVPGYPKSIDDNTFRRLITRITGAKTGAKSYYAQNKQIRRCKGPTVTILCMVAHPMVPLNPTPDDNKFTSQFDPSLVIAIRNPLTALPAHHQEKAVKYHKQVGQVDINAWREVRDNHITGMIEQWKTQIRDWKTLKHYQVGMYLSLEQLMDPSTGPSTIQKLANVLTKAGYETATDPNDMQCIWFHALGIESLQQYQDFKYEYTDYLPGFTKEQLNLIDTELTNFQQEFPDDKELKQILEGYQMHIRTVAIPDIVASPAKKSE